MHCIRLSHKNSQQTDNKGNPRAFVRSYQSNVDLITGDSYASFARWSQEYVYSNYEMR